MTLKAPLIDIYADPKHFTIPPVTDYVSAKSKR